MPLIKESMLQIQQALLVGDQSMADAHIALLQETLVRMGDESDVSRFVPKPPQPLMPGAMPGAPGAMPGAPGAMPGMPGAPPVGPVDPATGAPQNPEIVAPEMVAPNIQPPMV